MHRRSGSANLPLHAGRVPPWLSMRMAALGRVIAEAVVHEYGRDELLRRLAHPFWFQSFGAVMGMDWHSSGITTSVIAALKRGLTPIQHELGVYVCGGKGAHSRRTPSELLAMGETTGVDAADLVRASRLVAKVDSAAVQDGYELYLHAFFATVDGRWCVVQQGMNPGARQARRYHWQSEKLTGFFDSPHAAIEGRNVGPIVNLADVRAERNRAAGLELARNGPDTTINVLRRYCMAGNAARTLPLFAEVDAELGQAGYGQVSRELEIGEQRAMHEPTLREQAPGELQPHLQLPQHHAVLASDVMLRRLHGTLAAAAAAGPLDFADLLLTPGVGARTVAALAFVAEVIYGAPARFSDPARFSLAHGGKDGHPFPVPIKVFDQTIAVLKRAVQRAHLGSSEMLAAIRRLDVQARALEAAAADVGARGGTGTSAATGPTFDAFIAQERANSAAFGGRTVTQP